MNRACSATCYHCTLPIPSGVALTTTVGGEARGFCCTGCLLAYQLIHSSGLDEFYKRREQVVGTVRPVEPGAVELFDDPVYQERVVRKLAQECEVNLLLEGIHCAACVWLNEKVLAGIPGVSSARVNFSTQRARVVWDPTRLQLSRIIATVRQLGYGAEPYDPAGVEARFQRRDRDLLLRVGVSGFGAGNVMLLAVGLYAGYFQGIAADFKQFFHWITLLLSTPVVFYGGWPFLRGAWLGLRAGALTMDLPIALGALVTYFYSVAVTLSGRGEVYFDSAAMFIFFLLCGRYLEAVARRQAAGATERLLALTPRSATVVRAGQYLTVPIREVVVGDVVAIKPGEQLPVDGVVLEGSSSVNEAILTGESLAVFKGVGSVVAAGTTNVDGALLVHAERIGEDTNLARIIRLVEHAQTERPPLQRLADRVAGWFVGSILLLATVTAGYWWFADLEQLIPNTVALLIITCPCALGLAIPAAIVVASGAAAGRGILIKSGEVLERLARVRRVVLDKTGTLTLGVPTVERVVPRPGVTPERLLRAAAAAERSSEHPLGRAVVRHAEELGLDYGSGVMERFVNHPGWGVTAVIDGETILVGRGEFIARELGRELEPCPVEIPATPVGCAVDGEFLGWVLLSDRLRPDAITTVNELKGMGLELVLLSGDHPRVVERVGAEIGVARAIGGVLPERKSAVVGELQAAGTMVAMVGDGVNDAPAMAKAGVAIAVKNATDVSVEVADVVLLNERLSSVGVALRLAGVTLRVIRQNLWFSLGYNLLVIPLAMSGHVIPVLGAVAMPLSSLVVVWNALRIKRIVARL